MDAVPNLKGSEIRPFLAILETLQESGLLEGFDVDVHARMADVADRVRQVAALFYDAKLQELQAAPGVNRAMPLLLMTDELEKAAKLMDKRFPEPILGRAIILFLFFPLILICTFCRHLDVTSLLVEIVVPSLIVDLQNAQKRLYESSMNGPTPDIPIQDIFSLYRRTKTLLGMYKAFVPQ